MSKKIVIPKTPDLLRTIPSHNSYVGLSQDQLLQRVSQLHEQLNKINAYLIQTHKLSIYDYDINDNDFIEVALPSSKRGYLLDSTIKYRGDWDPVANIPKLDLRDRSKAGWAYMSIQRFDEHPVLGFIKEGDFLIYDAEGVLFNFSEILNSALKVETRQVGETIITYESGVIVSVSSDNVVEAIEYDVNGEVDKVTSTYADGKVYEETYTKDVNGNITKIMKVEVI